MLAEDWVEGEAVMALWQQLRDAPRGLVDIQELLKRLSRAIEAGAKADAGKFSAFMLAHIVGITASLLFRSHLHIARLASDHDARIASNSTSEFPAEHHRQTMSGVYELQRHLGELLQIQAQTARSFELTREKKLKNDREEQRIRTLSEQRSRRDFTDELGGRKPRGRKS